MSMRFNTHDGDWAIRNAKTHECPRVSLLRFRKADARTDLTRVA